MRAGSVRSVSAMYESTMVLHVALDDALVLTFIADAGANAGALRSLPPTLRDALRPLSETVNVRAN